VLDSIISTKHNEEDYSNVYLNTRTAVIKAELTNTHNSSIGRSNNYKFKCKNLIEPDSLENFDKKAWIKSLKDYRNGIV
jgi:hypothetical protein